MQETFVLEFLSKVLTSSLDLEILCNFMSVIGFKNWLNVPDEWQ